MQERRNKAFFSDTVNGNLGTLSRHWNVEANQNKSPYLIGGCVVSSDSRVFLQTEMEDHNQRLMPGHA